MAYFCLILAGPFENCPARERADDREAIRLALKERWDSLETLSFRDEDSYYQPGRELDPAMGRYQYTFAFKKPSKRLLISRKTIPEGEFETTNLREDGEKRYRILRGSKDPGTSIERVRIEKQPGDAERYEGESCYAHTLWCPAGQPLHVHVAGASEVSIHGSTAGLRRANVVSKHPTTSTPIRLELDEEYDWLPRSLEIGDGLLKLDVTKFDRVDGHWFPVQGKGRSRRDTGMLTSEFMVSDLKINEPIPDSTFRLANLPAGVKIDDQTKPRTPRKKAIPAPKSPGEPDAMPTASAPAGSPEPGASRPASKQEGPPIVAPRSPEEFPWALAVGGGSAAILMAGLWLLWRGRITRP